MPLKKAAYIILAGKQPPSIYRFERHHPWWFRKTTTLTEALEIARGLALINIHGVIKTTHPTKPTQPAFPKYPYIQPKTERRQRYRTPKLQLRKRKT